MKYIFEEVHRHSIHETKKEFFELLLIPLLLTLVSLNIIRNNGSEIV